MKVTFGDLPHHKDYRPETVKANKIIFTRSQQTGICYTDYKMSKISRVINKKGYIKLDGADVYVFDIEGVEFHYNEWINKNS